MTTTWTQISSLTAPSGGVFDFPSLTLTGYQRLQIVLSGITVTTDGTDVRLTFYVGGSEIVTAYRWGMQDIQSTASGVDDGNASATSILLVSDNVGQDPGNASGEGLDGIIMVDNPLSTALYKKATFQIVGTNTSSSNLTSCGSGVMENAGAIGGVKIGGTSNLVSGNVRILGMA